MAFVAAMNTPLTKSGVKGSDVYTNDGVGDARVALFQMLVRKCGDDSIFEQVKNAFSKSSDESFLRDFAVMAFQSRDVRGGKGERDIFYAMLFALATQRPHAIKALVNLIPEYGCWQDCWKIWVMAAKHATVCDHVRAAIMDLVKWIYFEDHAKLDKGDASISLLGKWLPREGSKYNDVALTFANTFYPEPAEQDDRWRAYRKGCVRLNAYLKTTEIAMCGHKWASIPPSTVPGRLLAKGRKAFLNEIVARKHKKRSTANTEEKLRHPDDSDRMECRTHFLEHTQKALAGEVTMKGAQTVYPHELVKKYFNNGHTTIDEQTMIEAQWKAIREAVGAAGGLRRAVAMCDFSGSMGGTPMEVSMALGILISEITHPAFRDHIIGFDSHPSWISLVGKASLKEKVDHARPFAQGTSTDFQAACDLILRRLIEHKVPQHEAPTDLIVMTDMGFDQACGNNPYAHNVKKGSWETHIQMIMRSFSENGYVPPRIVLWNLRAEYKDFHAKADDEGVVVLSGWSPSLLKVLSTKGVQVKTPYEGMRAILDAPRYDKVREAWDKVAPTLEK